MPEEMVIRLPVTPRDWQRPLLSDPSPRIVAVVHRRAGKSTALMWRGLRKAATFGRDHLPKARRNLGPSGDPIRVIHTLPYQVQWGRTGLWDRLAQASKAFPGAQILKAEMRVILPNGGVFQAGGMDRPDSWRGGYADDVTLDEYDDTMAEGQVTAIEPMLADYEGALVRSGTPKGTNRLRDAYRRAGLETEHSRYLLRWQDTKVLSNEAIDRLRAEMTEEEFAQELECSFETPNAGAFYGKLMAAADREGRIGRVPWEPTAKAHTAWDLGVSDSTAIWFVQLVGREVRVIDYHEDSGVGLDAYVRVLQAKPYVYGRHYLPHDVEVRELGSGKTRRETLASLGVKATVIDQHAVADGINAARILLPRCWFDAERCERGIRALTEYRREWVDKLGTFRASPLHDWTSHAADAWRYLAVGVRSHHADDGARKPFVASVGRIM